MGRRANTPEAGDERVRRLREALSQRILVLDGATGTGLALVCPEAAGARCPEELVLTRPEAVMALHRAYLAAGADLVETNTFGASPLELAALGLADRCREINRRAAASARKACARAEEAEPGRLRWVAGAIGPTSRPLTLTPELSFDQVFRSYAEQAAGLAEGGADLVLVETVQDPLNLKAALMACREAAPGVPVAVSITLAGGGRILGGTSAAAVAAMVEPWAPLWVGVNCSTGPAAMEEALRELAAATASAVAVVPNAGLPGLDGVYGEGPGELAEVVGGFARGGLVNLVGGCCGTTPEHIRALAAAAAAYPPRRPAAVDGCRLAGADVVDLAGGARPVVVGERTNVLGSRRFRSLVEERRWAEAAEVGSGQVAAGAAALDVCLAAAGDDEVASMAGLVPVLRRITRVPLMLDSTDPRVLATALERTPGRPVLNSVNLEDGGGRLTEVAELARRFGAAVVAGCVDDDPGVGMARTAQDKLRVAERLVARLEEEGLRRRDILLDPLVFPAGAGLGPAGAAAATLAGLRLIKERIAGAVTVLGISNVSYGLPPAGRPVLNAVFLQHCAAAGLDVAIADPERLPSLDDLDRRDRKLAEAVLFDGGVEATAVFVERFRARSGQRQSRAPSASVRERLAALVAGGRRTGLTTALDEALATMKALAVVNGPLLEGMATVGGRFQSGEATVAEVLLAAEVLQAALAYLRPRLGGGGPARRGSVLLATVRGDVHDIGKNLVGMVLAAHGFEVVDLGVQCSPAALIAAWRRRPTDLIGLSGLLVRSAQEMAVTARELAAAGIGAPLLLGGAALSAEFVRERVAPLYPGPAHYAPDVITGVALAVRLTGGGESGSTAGAESSAATTAGVAGAANTSRRQVGVRPTPAGSLGRNRSGRSKAAAGLPRPPDLERHLLADLPLGEILAQGVPSALVRRHLGLGGVRAGLDADGRRNHRELLRRVTGLQREAVSRGWLRGAAVFRFVRAWSREGCLVLADPEGQEVAAIPVAGQGRGGRLAAAVAGGNGAAMDSVALFVVSTGQGIRERTDAWRRKGRLLDSAALQVLALAAAEAAAGWLHVVLDGQWRGGGSDLEGESEAGYGRRRIGVRVSPGYPVLPDLAAQRHLFRLLTPEDIGVHLTEECMMDPEASVSAVVFHGRTTGGRG